MGRTRADGTSAGPLSRVGVSPAIDEFSYYDTRQFIRIERKAIRKAGAEKPYIAFIRALAINERTQHAYRNGSYLGGYGHNPEGRAIRD